MMTRKQMMKALTLVTAIVVALPLILKLVEGLVYLNALAQ